MEEQVVDLFKPIRAARQGAVPVALRVVSQPYANYVAGGVPSTSLKNETYVLLSALPEEIQQRVVTAINAITSGQ